MIKTRSWLSIGLLTMMSSTWAADLNVCVDPRFVKQDFLKIFVDMMSEATERAGHHLRLNPMDWENCQEQTKAGKFDGAVPASFNAERADYMMYPADAAANPNSLQALVKVDYVIVTPATKSFSYNGNPKTIPQPIMIPEGYSVVKDLMKMDSSLDVIEQGSDDRQNLRKLIFQGNGSVVMMKGYAESLMELRVFKGKLAISPAILNKTYYMPFSKNASIPLEQMNKIWRQFTMLNHDKNWLALHTRQEVED